MYWHKIVFQRIRIQCPHHHRRHQRFLSTLGSRAAPSRQARLQQALPQSDRIALLYNGHGIVDLRFPAESVPFQFDAQHSGGHAMDLCNHHSPVHVRSPDVTVHPSYGEFAMDFQALRKGRVMRGRWTA